MKDFMIAVFVFGVALCAASVQADIVQTVADSSVPLGGTTPNGGIFISSLPLPNPPQNVNGVTTSLISPYPGNATPGQLVFNVVDDSTGADFNYTLSYTCFTDVGGTQTATNARASSSVLSVDSTLAGEDRNAIDSAAYLGGNAFEFVRLALEDVTVNTDHDVTPIGFDSFVLRNIGGTEDAGHFIDFGTGALLGTWAQASDDYFAPVDLTDTTSTSLDVLPTGDRMQIKGFRASFDVTAAAVPEPSSLLLASLGIFAMVVLGRRRRKES